MKWYINIFKYLALIPLVCSIPIAVLAIDYEATISQIDYKTNYPEINLYISVIDSSGQPVPEMKQDEFIITENGKVTAITEFSGGIKGPITTTLVIDHSASMENVGKIESAKEAAIIFINQMRLEDKISLIIFNQHVEELQDFTSDKKLLINNINPITPSGSTAFYDAVYTAIDRLKPIQQGRKGIIVLTDGLDNQSLHPSDKVIQYAESENIPIYTIGLGTKEIEFKLHKDAPDEAVDERTLDRMAKQTGGRYFYTPSPEELAALYQLIAKQIQNEYLLSYNSPTPSYNVDKRKVVVKIRHNGVSFQATGSYNPTGFIYTPPYPLVSKKTSNWTIFTILIAILLFLLFLPKIIMGLKPLFFTMRPGEIPPSAHPTSVTTEEVKITLVDEGKKPSQETKKEEDEVNIVLVDKETHPLSEQKSSEEIEIVLLDEKEEKEGENKEKLSPDN